MLHKLALFAVGSLEEVREKAKERYHEFPHMGCAANLSTLLEMAGHPVHFEVSAGALVNQLKSLGWERIEVGNHKSGDVGVTYDTCPPPGADHVYLVVSNLMYTNKEGLSSNDKMSIIDNQDSKAHIRYITGHGHTATEYFLRAPEAIV